MKTITLEVKYKTPSANQLNRMHWAARARENRKAALALLSALQACADGYSTRITSPQASRDCLTALSTLGLFLMTPRKTSTRNFRSSRLAHKTKKRPSSK